MAEGWARHAVWGLDVKPLQKMILLEFSHLNKVREIDLLAPLRAFAVMCYSHNVTNSERYEKTKTVTGT